MLLQHLEEVEALYCLMLGRRAESLGVMSRFIGRSSLDAISELAGSEEFFASVIRPINNNDPTRHKDFAPPDWFNILDIFTRAQLPSTSATPHSILTSDLEACEDPVGFAYWEVFWRHADPQGREHYERVLAEGTSRQAIVEALSASPEAADKERFVNVADEIGEAACNAISQAFVDLSYFALLNRPADVGGSRHHLSAMKTGQADRRLVFNSLLQSPEAIALRKNRPGGEAVASASALAILLTSPFIAQSIIGLWGETGEEFFAKLQIHDLRNPQPDPILTENIHAADNYRGRPFLFNSSAHSIYHNLV